MTKSKVDFSNSKFRIVATNSHHNHKKITRYQVFDTRENTWVEPAFKTIAFYSHTSGFSWPQELL